MGQSYDKLVVGALIFDDRVPDAPTVLLLKRAANERYYPNIFEIPGGRVEDSDPTIRDAVVREVLEKTSLQVEGIKAAGKPFTYTMQKKATGIGAGAEAVMRTSLQLNFVCVVSGFDVKVNIKEHSEGRFVTRDGLGDINVTEEMRAVVEEAFGQVT